VRPTPLLLGGVFTGMTQHVILVEPFYGGSHKQLVDELTTLFTTIVHNTSHDDEQVVSGSHESEYKNLSSASTVEKNESQTVCHVFTLNDKKWHWRLRTSAAYFAECIPEIVLTREASSSSFGQQIVVDSYDQIVFFASSMMNLADFVALRPEFTRIRKILYFHENQLVYPVQKESETDFQLKWIQVMSAVATDVVLFNSMYNLSSFRDNIIHVVTTIPSRQARPKNLWTRLESKCQVMYFPVKIPAKFLSSARESSSSGLPKTEVCRILWPHRWEHDKDPETFFETMMTLSSKGYKFELVILGEAYGEVPESVQKARDALKEHIIHFGFLPSKGAYYEWLRNCDVVISTAIHEFFGVAIIEAATLGCFPLLPNRLSYPELFPKECLYNTPAQLFKRLKGFCSQRGLAELRDEKSPIRQEIGVRMQGFLSHSILPSFKSLLLNSR
jgi:glycosyltransferase involved in cell wall biosynthesis